MRHNIWKKSLVFCMLFCILFTVGCRNRGGDEVNREEEAVTSIKEADPDTLDEITMDKLVSEAMKDMTLEQKIGQLFIVNTDSLDFNAETKMTGTMKSTIEEYQPGGVIFFSFNLDNRKQIKKYIKKMQSVSRIPMFISVDEEGGTVARVANTEGMKTTKLPPMAEIGASGDSAKAYEAANTIGSDIAALGFNLDFAPVADLSTNEENTEIGERSFGSDPALVSDMVAQAVKGLQANGVSATLKHFPGQGDSGEDTHRGYVNLETTIERLREMEFKPFEAGIKAGTDFVMVSHVSVRSITQNEVPASLSPLMVNDILRGELQYDNLIITDAMNMKIITKFYDAGQAAVMALEAGNDMILMPDDFVSAVEAIETAISDGTLSERRINQSVKRIIERKIRRGILPLDSPVFEQILS